MIKVFRGGERIPLPSAQEVQDRIQNDPVALRKFAVLTAAGWSPHPAQIIFHLSKARFRVSGAGRRGGKTESAAWEFGYLCHPDYGREALADMGVQLPEEDVPLIAMVVTPESGFQATPRALMKALDRLGVSYVFNKSDRALFVGRGDHPEEKPTTIVYFKSGAHEASRFRGEGVSFAWWDEPAFIKSSEAWDAFRPSLGERRGICIFTTSPGAEDAHWWFYDYFIYPALPAERGKAKDPSEFDPSIEYVQWWSEDNPLIPREEIEAARRTTHPIIFKREWQAEWSRGHGNVLKEDWLRYFRLEELPDVRDGRPDPSRYSYYVGVDPAISENPEADYTAWWVLAKHNETGLGYLVDGGMERLAFPDQLDLLVRLKLEWQPTMIGVEAVAYQRALQQQASRMPELLGTYIWPMNAPGKKEERLMALGPVMRSGIVKCQREHVDLVEQWVQFPNAPHDDVLDALDITIRTAGLFAGIDVPADPTKEHEEPGPRSVAAHVKEHLRRKELAGADPHLGSMW